MELFLRVLLWLCLAHSVRSDCQSMPIVSLQLKWLQQTQFAGYFAAQEQGFYYDECLTVNIRPGGPAIVIEDEVLQGRAQFGITWASLALVALNQGKNVTVVSQIFQRVGMRMVSFASENIHTMADFQGKKVCITGGGDTADLRAAFAQNNLTWDNDTAPGVTNPPNNSIDVVNQFSIAQLLSHQCDVAAAETYNEYAQILLSEKSPGQLYTPADLNTMSYDDTMLEDMLIASSEWLENPANQDIAVRFLRASFRGWIYARANPMKTVDIFADKSPLQIWQMNEVNRLMWPAPLGIGVVPLDMLQNSADIAYEFGLTSRQWNVSEFVRLDLSLLAHQGIEADDVQGLSYKPQFLAFCLANGNPEICDTSQESSASFVDPASTIGVIIGIVTILGLIFAGACAALLFHWREEKVIRSASLPFSILMCTGAIIGLVSNFFYLNRPVDGTCHARAWLLGLGFITFFGNFLVKVWRIHAIFSGRVLVKIKVPDSRLYAWFSFLFAIQVVLLGLYSGLGAPQALRVAHSNDYTQFDTLCVTTQSDLWNLLLALFAAVLMVYGVYLAIQVRHIQSLYNEAKLLGGSIYNCIFVAVVCGPILLFVDMPPTSVALITALATFAMFTGSLAIVFLPRFFIVRSKRSPTDAQNRQSRSDNSHSSLLIDTEAMKTQDKEQLMASREQALALKEQAISLIKAIDAELDRRARSSCAITTLTPHSHSQRLSQQHSRGEQSRGEQQCQLATQSRGEAGQSPGQQNREAGQSRDSVQHSQERPDKECIPLE